MTQTGTKKEHAAELADVLVAADYRGHYSHGLNRLGNIVLIKFGWILNHFIFIIEMYVQDVETKICEGNAVPTIVKDKFSTALVDGQNSLGPVVGNFCMNLAIEKAKNYGVGWVTANSILNIIWNLLIFFFLDFYKFLMVDSNHYGIAGWYSLLAANKGFMVKLL